MHKDLKQVTVIGLGLLGGSIALGVNHSFSGVRVVGFSHRPSTRQRAKEMAIGDSVAESLAESVRQADLVILSTPISTFEKLFEEMSPHLQKGCIVTDVGSTKILPHKWAAKTLSKQATYIGSHPIAGSEQRGVEYARDDLFVGAACILTKPKNTDPAAVEVLKTFWQKLGCVVSMMTPTQHDRIFAYVSHVPHITAAALVNATGDNEISWAGKGFMDTSRIASGPANIWADILSTNPQNCVKGIDRVIAELEKIKKAVTSGDRKKIETVLEKARLKRNNLIKLKIDKKEIL